jgi:hypothetical protein
MRLVPSNRARAALVRAGRLGSEITVQGPFPATPGQLRAGAPEVVGAVVLAFVVLAVVILVLLSAAVRLSRAVLA